MGQSCWKLIAHLLRPVGEGDARSPEGVEVALEQSVEPHAFAWIGGFNSHGEASVLNPVTHGTHVVGIEEETSLGSKDRRMHPVLHKSDL